MVADATPAASPSRGTKEQALQPKLFTTPKTEPYCSPFSPQIAPKQPEAENGPFTEDEAWKLQMQIINMPRADTDKTD